MNLTEIMELPDDLEVTSTMDAVKRQIRHIEDAESYIAGLEIAALKVIEGFYADEDFDADSTALEEAGWTALEELDEFLATGGSDEQMQQIVARRRELVAEADAPAADVQPFREDDPTS